MAKRGPDVPGLGRDYRKPVKKKRKAKRVSKRPWYPPIKPPGHC